MSKQFPSLRDQGWISFDTETCDPDLLTRGPGVRRGAFICGISIATEAGFAAYFPIRHERSTNLPKERVLDWVNTQLRLPVQKIGANVIYDLDFLEGAGVKPTGPFYDIQIAEPLINENQYSYSLETLAQKYLGVGKTEDTMAKWIVEHLAVKPKEVKNNIWRAPAEIVAPYAIDDARLPLRIMRKQMEVLEENGLLELFDLETSIIPMLLAMRQRGVRVDLPKAEEMYARMKKQQAEITANIKRRTGCTVEPWNVKSIMPVYQKLGIKLPLTAKTKKPSLTKLWMQNSEEEISKEVLELRRLDKMSETFVKGFIINGHTKGRIHCQFNQLKGDDNGTVTGRFSSSMPNLQQIPVRSADGKLIRSIFIPSSKRHLWGKYDYSQIEYRLLANDAIELELEGSEQVLAAYQKDDADFHQIVAEMTGLSRSDAKNINFGIAYGEGVKKLCRALGLEFKEGMKLLDEYHEKAPFMKPLMQRCIREARKTGMIKTIFGRRRHFEWFEMADGSMTRDPEGLSERAYTYKALNARTQGSAADIFKQAMRDVWESGVCDILGPPPLIVHDEMDFDVPDTKAGREAFAEVKNIMENAVKLLIPLKVGGGLGPNWGSIQ